MMGRLSSPRGSGCTTPAPRRRTRRCYFRSGSRCCCIRRKQPPGASLGASSGYRSPSETAALGFRLLVSSGTDPEETSIRRSNRPIPPYGLRLVKMISFYPNKTFTFGLIFFDFLIAWKEAEALYNDGFSTGSLPRAAPAPLHQQVLQHPQVCMTINFASLFQSKSSVRMFISWYFFRTVSELRGCYSYGAGSCFGGRRRRYCTTKAEGEGQKRAGDGSSQHRRKSKPPVCIIFQSDFYFRSFFPC